MSRLSEYFKFLGFGNNQVVNDGDMNLWRELGVSSWPTFALVGPNGKLIGQLAGEGRREVLILPQISILVFFYFFLTKLLTHAFVLLHGFDI